ncbi:ATPase, T2SS/T4P/T4SS family [Viridibacillus arvi]|uniref:ATPase, T2SS/T4P/T4SS family n=1 Tax=Viridibacillus arvi TaxID=263475 RepID=UPI003D2A1B8A
MNFWLNATVIGLIFLLVVIFVVWKIRRQNKELMNIQQSNEERARYKIEIIENFIKNRMTELTAINLYGLGLSEEEFVRRTRRRQELKEALKNCNTGDLSSKIYVREYINDILMNEYGFDEEKINWPIPYATPAQMTAREQFDTILYLYRKEHGENGLGQLISKYNLDVAKPNGAYRINDEDIRSIYKQEVKRLKFEDKLYILSERIYSSFKGFGVIDEIRDMNIDGVSGGVSGLPKRMESFQSDQQLIDTLQKAKSSLNSVWVMYKGKSIHFSFLSFEHEAELRRVVTNIYKYGYPGQLSENRPYIINEMFDGSRVTVIRPKLAESWVFFIRKKFDLKKLSLYELIAHPQNELPIKMMKFLMRGNRLTAITGSQGSGKTTLLMALIKYVHPSLNLRIQETSFELNLRSLYPERNILSFQETDTMSGQDGLDLQKKTDGHVNILGEVATDPVAAWMIQTAQVASLFTVFTHHAKTFANLVYSLRNSLLKVGMFSNEAIAEQQVVNVLEFDIHLRQDYDGTRYIERITECIPVDHSQKAMDVAALSATNTKDEKFDLMVEAATMFFRQQTQRQQFIERNIIEFHDGKYIAKHKISDDRIQSIANQLDTNERAAFLSFISEVWGGNE